MDIDKVWTRDLGSAVNDILDEYGVSQGELALILGLSRPMLSQSKRDSSRLGPGRVAAIGTLSWWEYSSCSLPHSANAAFGTRFPRLLFRWLQAKLQSKAESRLIIQAAKAAYEDTTDLLTEVFHRYMSAIGNGEIHDHSKDPHRIKARDQVRRTSLEHAQSNPRFLDGWRRIYATLRVAKHQGDLHTIAHDFENWNPPPTP